MAWAKNITSSLSSGNNVIEITGMTKYKFNTIMTHMTGGSATVVDFKGQLGDGSYDTGSNYATRESQNGTENTRTSATTWNSGLVGYDNDNANSLHITYGINIAAEEKLFIQFGCLQGNAVGASTAPSRYEIVYKWTDTTNQFDQFKYINNSGDTYDTDTNLSSIGTD